MREIFTTFVDNHDFLVLQDKRISDFSQTRFLSGIAALTAFNRNASGVNGSSCRYKGVEGIVVEYLRRYWSLRGYTSKLVAYSQQSSNWVPVEQLRP